MKKEEVIEQLTSVIRQLTCESETKFNEKVFDGKFISTL